MNNLIELLNNPSSEYRSKPFWSWNGKLDIRELKRQIDVMHEMGFGGFFMHSRTGLETEYLSEKWFEIIRQCSSYAYELGMEAWLYDEDRWPSGTCGGVVTQNPEYVMKFISLYHDDAKAFPVLARFAYKNSSEYFAVQNKSEVPSDYKYCVFCVEPMENSSFYNGSAYLDTMNPKAVKEYIKSTHEKYKKQCGDMFGREIKGIFTDEPHRGPLFSDFGLSNKNAKNMCPYTPSLFEEYQKAYNEDLKGKLPELFFSGKNITGYRYVELLQKLFIDAFAKQYHEWCKENNLIFTGHVLHEDCLGAQVLFQGSVMRFYEHMDYPGIDNLTVHNNCYIAAKQAVSVAKQTGKKFVLSELYGASGWDSGLEQFKQAGDWQAFYGITLRCPHLSMYSMKGEAKRDYPASILHQSGLKEDFAYLEDYYARLSLLTSNTEEIGCQTLFVTPIEALEKKIKKDWISTFTPTEKDAQEIEQKFFENSETLRKKHISFDYGDEHLIEKLGVVEIKNGNTFLRIGKSLYNQVLLTHCPRYSIFKILNEFQKDGGTVTNDVASLDDGLVKYAPEDIAITLRQNGNSIFAIAMNFSREKDYLNDIINLKFAGYTAKELDLKTGLMTGMEYNAENITASFYRGQERCFLLEKSPINNKKTENLPIQEIKGKYPYKLKEPNVLVIDSAKIFLDGVLFKEGNIYEIQKELRQKYNLQVLGYDMIQPWFKNKYQFSKKNLANLKIQSEFSIMDMPKECYLALEGDFSVKLNGKPAPKTQRFWTDICYSVYDLSELMTIGTNTVELSCLYAEDVYIENFFLLGNFGVELSGVICSLPKLLSPFDFAAQKLPHYGGGISFDLGIQKKKSILSLNKTQNTAVVKFKIGTQIKNASFFPYQAEADANEKMELEITLSQRNIFGPFYTQKPLSYYCDPTCFGKNRNDKIIID